MNKRHYLFQRDAPMLNWLRTMAIGVLLPLASVSVALANGSRSAADLLKERQARHEAEQAPPLVAATGNESRSGLAASPSWSTDFPAVTDDAASRFIQQHPLCLPSGSSGGVVLFRDERDGPFGLWGVPVNASGVPQGGNVLVRASAGLGGLGIPMAVRNGTGLILVAYPDADSGGVFVLSVADGLTASSSVNRVSPVEAAVDRPDIAATSSGAIVVWEDYRSGSHIYARRTDQAGTPSGAEFKVNASALSAARWVPKAAVGDGDTTLVVWEDYRSGEPDIYYRVFTGSGAAITGDVLATTGGPAAPRYQPDVVYGEGYGFLLAWIDLRGGAPTVYGRLIRANGVPAAGEFVFADPGDTAVFWEPALASDGNTQAVVTYESVAQRTMISGQRFYLDAVFGNPFAVSPLSAARDRFHPAVSYRGDGGMLFVWTDNRTEQRDAHARTFTVNAVPLGDDRKLNDDAIGNQQHVGGAAATQSSVVYVTYTDERHDAGDIHVQQLTPTSQVIGDPVLINDDFTAARQAEPAIAAWGDGTLFVAWTDARLAHTQGEYDIYGQPLPGGVKSGLGNLRLSDDTDSSAQSQPDVAVFPGGGAVVVWTDYRLGDTAAIFGQVIDDLFSREGPNFQVGASFPRPDDTPPRVAAFNVEHSAIGWRADSSGHGTIWIQWFSRAVGPLNDPFRLAIDSAAYNPETFDLVRTVDDGFGVCWIGRAANRSAVFFQQYSKMFARVGVNVTISDGGEVHPGRVSVDADDAGFLVFSWTEELGGKPTVVRRIVDPAGAPIGPVEVVSDDAGDSFSFAPVAVATGRSAGVLFGDNRLPGKGYDVRAAFHLYSPTAIADGEDKNIPDRAMLLQNYPNPFNASTVITFSVPTAGTYELAVYDILGRRVRTLTTGYLSAGSASILWGGTDDDGHPVPSGIYFSRLHGSSFATTRKMTLLK